MLVLNSIIYFIIVIGILVVVHEFGHFIAARLTGTRAEIFSVGMGFRVCGFNRINGFTFGKLPADFDGGNHTDYRLSLFPIGGYVKVAGMIDESMDKSIIQNEAQPWEFRSKNSFQKILIMSAGVLMNIILGIAIFAIISFYDGKEIYGTTTIGFVEKNSLAEQIGFYTGDKIISINNQTVNHWEDFIQSLAINDLGQHKQVKLIRNNNTVNINIDGKKIISALENQTPFGIYPENLKTFIIAVESLKPAGKAGIMPGDTVVAINNIQLNGGKDEFVSIVKSNKNNPLLFQWKHQGRLVSNTLTPSSEGMVGVQISNVYCGNIIHIDYGFFEAIYVGYKETIDKTELFISSIIQMFRGNISTKSIGGPIMIAKSAAQQAELGMVYFFQFMALLSISLAVINILPFPALDGGHILLVLIEMIIRRELPVKAKLVYQQIGMIVLLLLIVFIIYNDIAR